jgi:DNA (cytosine-5)-methyltransferase 1
LGRFESFNLDLLAKLARRPKTIVNPPRMRKDDFENSLSDWYGEAPRMRQDAVDYVPNELKEQFQFLLDGGRRRRGGAQKAAPTEEAHGPVASLSENWDPDSEKDAPLAAAE